MLYEDFLKIIFLKNEAFSGALQQMKFLRKRIHKAQFYGSGIK
jgi:hypothetical protein